MITLIVYYRLGLLAAFVIGVATAWRIWGRAPHVEATRDLGLPPAPERQQEPEVRPQHAAAQDGDDLTRIRGIDADTASMLNLLGIRQYGEIADWTEIEAEEMTVLLGAGARRIAEGRWIEQARLLASGDRAAFDQQFGQL